MAEQVFVHRARCPQILHRFARDRRPPTKSYAGISTRGDEANKCVLYVAWRFVDGSSTEHSEEEVSTLWQHLRN